MTVHRVRRLPVPPGPTATRRLTAPPRATRRFAAPPRTVRRLAASLLAALFLAAGALLPATPVHAAPGDDFRWSVRPAEAGGGSTRSQFTYDLAPGRHIDDRVAIKNLSTRTLNFSVYAADAFTSADGAFALPVAGSRSDDAGRWLQLKPVRRTVKPGGQIVLPFRIAVPKDAAPGDHAAGVLASVTVPAKNADGQTVMVDRRIAARVYVRVDGPLRPRLTVESVSAEYDNPLIPFLPGRMTVTYTLRNTGNVRLSGDAAIGAAGPLGIPLSSSVRRPVPEMLPGSAVTLTDRIGGVVPAGLLTGEVSVTPSGLLEETGEATTWQIPWTVLYLLVVAAAVVAFVIVRRRRKARQP